MHVETIDPHASAALTPAVLLEMAADIGPHAEWSQTHKVKEILDQFFYHMEINDTPEKPADVYELHAAFLAKVVSAGIQEILEITSIDIAEPYVPNVHVGMPRLRGHRRQHRSHQSMVNS